MDKRAVKAIAVGGSAGCLPVIMQLLKALPNTFTIPIIIVVHRQRNVSSEMIKLLATAHPLKKIIEPDDKDPVKDPFIYLAPQNYHLLVEEDETFSLDYSEPIQFSRPSIDVTFESAANVYKTHLVAILLSGANNDGTVGLQSIIKNGGTAIVQDPATADYNAMPLSAIKNCEGVLILSPEKMIDYLNGLNK